MEFRKARDFKLWYISLPLILFLFSCFSFFFFFCPLHNFQVYAPIIPHLWAFKCFISHHWLWENSSFWAERGRAHQGSTCTEYLNTFCNYSRMDKSALIRSSSFLSYPYKRYPHYWKNNFYIEICKIHISFPVALNFFFCF